MLLRRLPSRLWRLTKATYWKAYEDNVTGQAAMVAYNLLLSILPFGLLALFVTGKVVESNSLRNSVLRDLQRLFPTAAEHTLNTALDNAASFSTRAGILALVASIWIGSSFWGAVDTAFCRIYHVRCRTWLEQKRFAVMMLVVVLLFMSATVVVPTVQSILYNGAADLPLGLAQVRNVIFVITLVASVTLLFLVLCVIYWAVPNRLMPWRAVWPGAALATFAIGVIDYAFPFYISNISTLAEFGTTLVFVLIVLFWFYALAFIILVGAEINALRFERWDTQQYTSAAAATHIAEAWGPTPASARAIADGQEKPCLDC
jgi:membrane protein